MHYSLNSPNTFSAIIIDKYYSFLFISKVLKIIFIIIAITIPYIAEYYIIPYIRHYWYSIPNCFDQSNRASFLGYPYFLKISVSAGLRHGTSLQTFPDFIPDT